MLVIYLLWQIQRLLPPNRQVSHNLSEAENEVGTLEALMTTLCIQIRNIYNIPAHVLTG